MSLIISLENAEGKDVNLEVFPNDTFQEFIDRASEILGYTIDQASISGDNPTLPTDNIYDYLLRMVAIEQEAAAQDSEDILPDMIGVESDSVPLSTDVPMTDLNGIPADEIAYDPDNFEHHENFTENVQFEENLKQITGDEMDANDGVVLQLNSNLNELPNEMEIEYDPVNETSGLGLAEKMKMENDLLNIFNKSAGVVRTLKLNDDLVEVSKENEEECEYLEDYLEEEDEEVPEDDETEDGEVVDDSNVDSLSYSGSVSSAANSKVSDKTKVFDYIKASESNVSDKNINSQETNAADDSDDNFTDVEFLDEDILQEDMPKPAIVVKEEEKQPDLEDDIDSYTICKPSTDEATGEKTKKVEGSADSEIDKQLNKILNTSETDASDKVDVKQKPVYTRKELLALLEGSSDSESDGHKTSQKSNESRSSEYIKQEKLNKNEFSKEFEKIAKMSTSVFNLKSIKAEPIDRMGGSGRKRSRKEIEPEKVQKNEKLTTPVPKVTTPTKKVTTPTKKVTTSTQELPTPMKKLESAVQNNEITIKKVPSTMRKPAFKKENVELLNDDRPIPDGYPCRLCNRKFDKLLFAITHTMVHKVPERPVYPCVLCHYGFTSFLQVRDHMRRDHANAAKIFVPPTKKNPKKPTQSVKKVDHFSVVASENSTKIEKLPVVATQENKKMERSNVGLAKDSNSKKLDKLREVGAKKIDRLPEVTAKKIVDRLPEVAARKIVDRLREVATKKTIEKSPAVASKKLDKLPEVTAKRIVDRLREVSAKEDKKAEKLAVDDIKQEMEEEWLDDDVEILEEWLDDDIEEIVGARPKMFLGSPSSAVNRASDVDYDEGLSEYQEEEEEEAGDVHEERIKQELDAWEEENPLASEDDWEPPKRGAESMFSYSYKRGKKVKQDEKIGDEEKEGKVDASAVGPKVKKEGVELYRCALCGQAFPTSRRLVHHRSVHQAELLASNLTCSDCGRDDFESESALYDHLNTEHNDLFMCLYPHCYKEFHLRSSLNTHSWCHGKKKIKCTVCFKQFADTQTLKNHMTTHLKVKPFQCHICLKFINRRNRLRMHLLAHEAHPKKNSVLSCRHCHMAFRTVDDALDHIVDSETCRLSLDPDSTVDLCPLLPTEDKKVEKNLERLLGEEGTTPDEAATLESDQTEKRTLQDVTEDLADKTAVDGDDCADLLKELGGETTTDVSDVKNMDIGDSENVGLKGASETENLGSKDISETENVGSKGASEMEGVLSNGESGKRRLSKENILSSELASPKKCKVATSENGNDDDVGSDKRVAESESGDDSSEGHAPNFKRVEERLAEVPETLRHFIGAVQLLMVLRCEFCEKVFCTKDSLNQHREIHRDRKFPFECNVCHLSFETYARVTTHKVSHGFFKDTSLQGVNSNAKGAGFVRETSASQVSGYNPFPVVKYFLCQLCGRTFLHHTYFSVHVRKHHPAPGESAHPCPTCKKEFLTVHLLQTHLRRAHGARKKPRPESKISLRNTIPEATNYRCLQCKENFATRKELLKHHRNVHDLISNDDEGTYSCNICTKVYQTKVGLEGHIRVHKGKLFLCQTCGSGFAHQAGLITHHRRVHERNHEHHCDKCEQTFFTQAELLNHMRRHTGEKPFSCDHCSMKFRTSGRKNEHMRVHTGERPFPCDVCGLAFRRKIAMKNHRLIHSGTRAHVCNVCGKRFLLKSILKAHMKNKHSTKFLIMKIKGGQAERAALEETLNSIVAVNSDDVQELATEDQVGVVPTMETVQIPVDSVDGSQMVLTLNPIDESQFIMYHTDPTAEAGDPDAQKYHMEELRGEDGQLKYQVKFLS